ncbi:TetR/AcrR family transcriptional regulator [Phytohabitans rumicis]|uniref:TetR family transcriptional regulator n=1 Tax=Phytohabitans rumicis TaxID=1076125 RepID=A0A6V8L851_9ACTN|nr:TetR/AcrR family transcriptional regulator [Phytohabitans rumicis]GFJ88835.1 TetR family transcriptional regulator [Phytohabitans rumicis]
MVAEDTKARIRAVAMELFTAQGYEQTSLREIADRVGMTKASLYYHYPSKQALLLALVQPLVDDWRWAVEYAESQPHNPDTVRVVLGQFLDVMLRHRSACALFMRDVPAVLATIQPIWAEVIELASRLHTWLAGPDPTDVERIRAVAAAEALGAALNPLPILADVSPAVIRGTLLDAAAAVLGLPRVLRDQGVPQVAMTT